MNPDYKQLEETISFPEEQLSPWAMKGERTPEKPRKTGSRNIVKPHILELANNFPSTYIKMYNLYFDLTIYMCVRVCVYGHNLGQDTKSFISLDTQ